MSERLFETEGDRFRVYLSKSCLCYPCWQARCIRCDDPLTKHAVTREDAIAEATWALDRPGRFQHRCES